ncbi:MAG: HAMP domain-containing histidine kinase [Bacteroides sp.]|uniref:tetratricopeptide repeat-containing sensor histidine kinase n=1 Tax=Bacteroides sp. TaxID=29523 RepID=UPI0025C16590|nr:HAMP domain-containing sensor histidine kinase [Bacteroides sp.]MBS6240231.1 HAMP domain-containing histidine kinase [Bacteroides sp.]
MRNLLKHFILHIVCFGCIFPLSAGEDSLTSPERITIQDEVIDAFHNSMGFDYLTKEESAVIDLDSILNYLESTKQYETYFELERILVKSYLFRGEIRMAIAWSEQMYSKASALSHTIGTVLALNAIGEVYSYTGRNKEAGDAHVQALEMLDQMDGGEVHVRILLVELIEYNLRIHNFVQAAHFMNRLNSFSSDKLSGQEQAVRHIFNAYCQLFNGSVKIARQHLDKVEPLKDKLVPGIMQHLLVADAMYWERIGEYEKSLTAYDAFLHTDYAEINCSLYKEVLQDRADLLLKMGRKEEAYKQYGAVYSYIKSAFEKNYPKEIDQLTTRFQADQLTYQNERDRLFSYRLYLGGIVVCTLFLLLFLYLSWRKIFRLKESKCSQEKMIQKAERAIQKKNMFLSNMSHEVRTPLNAIVGFSAVLASEDDSFDEDSRKEFCEIIKVNSFQLLKLINDILDFSDFENDNITFNIRPYDAVKLCKEASETVNASRKLEVELRFDTELPELMIETDDARLRQVLINLLVNATKFTKEGSIVLRLELSDRNTAFFSVTDTGCGIPLEKQGLIFERFEKLNDFAQGSGLGLSICQLIVTYMRGRIWVDSNYTQGARFCFTHPLKYKPKAEGAV